MSLIRSQHFVLPISRGVARGTSVSLSASRRDRGRLVILDAKGHPRASRDLTTVSRPTLHQRRR